PAAGLMLVAYVVLSGAGASVAEVARYLRGRLPAHLVPAAFAALPALPLTAHGKVDRRALQALPLPERAAAGGARRAAESPSEQLVEACFGELLGVERVGLDDDFFALGGHSLLATRLVSRLRRSLGVEVPLRLVFEHPTVGGLAAQVERLLRR